MKSKKSKQMRSVTYYVNNPSEVLYKTSDT